MRTNQPDCVVIGAGGHAAVVIDAIQESKCANIVEILDRNPDRWNQTVLGYPISSGDDRLTGVADEGISHFCVGVGSVSVSGAEARKKLFDSAVDVGLQPLTVIHPAASVSKNASIGDGTVILSGAVVAARANVGFNVIVNNGAIIEHDNLIGDHTHSATGSVLAGNVEIGSLSHIGAGAIVRQAITIGSRSVVGAGAVVIRDVQDDTTVYGNPARISGGSDSRTNGPIDGSGS